MNNTRYLRTLLAVVALCTSCSTSEPPPPASIDVELYPYYEQFYMELAARRLPAAAAVRSIKWVDRFSKDTIGLCSLYESYAAEIIGTALGIDKPRIYTYRMIAISRRADPIVLKRLMFHELGHCILNFMCHSTNTNDIMFPSVTTAWDKESSDAMFQRYAEGKEYTDCGE